MDPSACEKGLWEMKMAKIQNYSKSENSPERLREGFQKTDQNRVQMQEGQPLTLDHQRRSLLGKKTRH